MQPSAFRLFGTMLGMVMVLAGTASAQVPSPPLSDQIGQPVVTAPGPPPPIIQRVPGQSSEADLTAPANIPAGVATDPAVNPPSSQATGAAAPAAASVAEPATAPAPAVQADGTAPGNDGSTGWTGGTGGSNIGTSPQGANAASKTWQPPTARGLDLMGVADPVSKP